MQFYSFDMQDPVFEIAQWKLSFQIVTLENIYGIVPAQTTALQQDDSSWLITSNLLSWAGQQQTASGSFSASITSGHDNRICLNIKADAPHKIRAIKILVRDLPPLSVLDMLDNPVDIPDDGRIERYPNPLRLPLCMVQPQDKPTIGFRCEDPHARAKRFGIFQERFGAFAGRYTVECIHEEDARWFSTHIDVPSWIIAEDVSSETFRQDQLTFNEVSLGTIPWEQRTDIAPWVRDLRLCLTIHGMHWSGYIFNTYAQMLEIIRYAAGRIEGQHILAYLPGWEGRYYWQYGDFRPDPRLGGEDGFAALCAEAKVLGVHVMPMFGANCANAWAPSFNTFGPSSYMKSATRNIFHGNQPDWDMSREHDTGWQAWLNPGAPAWQTELTYQIRSLIDRYQFDAVFLDTVEVWVNDPDFNIRDGLTQLCDQIRAGRPEVLIAAEDWWDGLLGIMPIFQQTAMWRQVPDWVGRYVRLIGHICDSEPSRGSTGVFESGYRPYQRLPEGNHYIPTISFVDNTLSNARVEVDAVIALAAQQNI